MAPLDRSREAAPHDIQFPIDSRSTDLVGTITLPALDVEGRHFSQMAIGADRSDEAIEYGHDAFEETTDYATSAPGYIAEATGHVTIIADRRDRVLLGAFIAAPGAPDAIGEAVLAIKVRTPVEVLADTIHPFPTTVRVMGGLFSQAAHREG